MELIPLDRAHQIMGTFGITSPTQTYERLVRPDGLAAADLAEVLEDSPFVFITDDSIELYDDLVEPVVEAIGQMGVMVELERDEDGLLAAVSVTFGPGIVIRLDEVASYAVVDRTIRAIQSLAPELIEFRKRVGDDAGGDCWVYAVLSPAEWRELGADGAISTLFEALPRAS